jgi:NAD(P)-dependent dehydrogenase (short-subunit alcohol dehydrogenase family)
VWDDVMAVNVTANWRLIRSLDPLLRKSDAGRALFLSSNIGVSCPPFLGPYAASKAAVEALAKTYSAETRTTDLKVIVVSPGAMRTAMRAQFMPGEDPDSLPKPIEIVPYLIDMAAADFAQGHVRFNFPTKSYTPYPD